MIWGAEHSISPHESCSVLPIAFSSRWHNRGISHTFKKKIEKVSLPAILSANVGGMMRTAGASVFLPGTEAGRWRSNLIWAGIGAGQTSHLGSDEKQTAIVGSNTHVLPGDCFPFCKCRFAIYISLGGRGFKLRPEWKRCRVPLPWLRRPWEVNLVQTYIVKHGQARALFREAVFPKKKEWLNKPSFISWKNTPCLFPTFKIPMSEFITDT